jgi:TRAP-type mannitol/chloroaromatic compound transport system permease small subunit
MKTILKAVDSISEWGGRAVKWFSIILVALMTYEVIMRYVFDAPTLWGFETAIMLGATLYVIGWSWGEKHGIHIRVDVIYSRLSNRGKAIIDVIGMLVLTLPILVIMVINSVNYAVIAWANKERLDFTIWYPPSGPLRTIIAIGFTMFTLQCLAQLFRDIHLLIRDKPYG